MMNRFASTTPEELANIRRNVDAKNTQLANKRAAKTFRDYLEEKNLETDFENFDKEMLNDKLISFYVDTRKTDGNNYKTSSLENFRHSLNRYLLQKTDGRVNIVKDVAFTNANLSFRAMMAELKRNGMGITKHYPIIDKIDLTKLYASQSFDTDIPTGLANKVQFDIRMYFMRRGGENFHKMTVKTFQILYHQETGLKYVCKAIDELTKNHRETDKGHCGDGFMPEMPGNPMCPVTSFEKYLSKLHPGTDRLWQKARNSYLPEESVWFSKVPIGEKTLQKFMPHLSEVCALSKRYTNHSIRATGATILSRKNFNNAQIMSVSGHRSVSSLAVYQRVAEREKIDMGRAIGDCLNNDKALTTFPSNNSCGATSSHTNTNKYHNQKQLEYMDLDLNELEISDFHDNEICPSTSNLRMNLPVFKNCTINNVNIIIKK